MCTLPQELPRVHAGVKNANGIYRFPRIYIQELHSAELPSESTHESTDASATSQVPHVLRNPLQSPRTSQRLIKTLHLKFPMYSGTPCRVYARAKRYKRYISSSPWTEELPSESTHELTDTNHTSSPRTQELPANHARVKWYCTPEVPCVCRNLL